MNGSRRPRHRRSLSLAALCAVVLSALASGAAYALPYDGTDPSTTICGDGSHTMYTLGKRDANHPQGDEGIPTPIYSANGVKIGEVEIRHSRKCATVWSRVTNLSGATTQVKEAIVVYDDSNGNGRTEHWYPTTDTVADNKSGWSNQYRDRASFSAIGEIYYSGQWRSAETARAVAWVQNESNFANTPYACNHTANWPCRRWPTLSNGLSVTRYYFNDLSLRSMPAIGGGQYDMTGDVDFIFGKFNTDVNASNPFFYTSSYPSSDVWMHTTTDCGIYGQTTHHVNSTGYYDSGAIEFSTCTTWDSDVARGTACHEIDHLMGLWHDWWHDMSNVDNVGSKATCIGMGSPTGPRIDDSSALDDVYSGVVP